VITLDIETTGLYPSPPPESKATEDFIVAIENVNKQYGLSNGAEQVYLKDNILILEVRSYAANKDLNINNLLDIIGGGVNTEYDVG
jgi:hypothetical protein